MVSVLCTAFSSSFFPQGLPQLRKDLPPPALDVVVVGAGAAGVGTALMLTTTFGLDASRVLLVERGEEVAADLLPQSGSGGSGAAQAAQGGVPFPPELLAKYSK